MHVYYILGSSSTYIRTEVLPTSSSTRLGFELVGSNSWPSDRDNSFYVTETSALTTRPSVTSLKYKLMHVYYIFGSSSTGQKHNPPQVRPN